MPYGEVVLNYSSISWTKTVMRDYIGLEQYGGDDSKIVVLHEDGSIKDVMNDMWDSSTITFGGDLPSEFKVNNSRHLHNNNSYDFSKKYVNIKLEHSRFNVAYGADVFCMMRMRSSDKIPRFVFYFDDKVMNKYQSEQLIKRILMGPNDNFR
jgi:hypothetical protein